MNTMRDSPKFIRNLEKEGMFASVVSIEHLDELGSEVRSLHDDGRLNGAFYKDYAKPFFTPELPKRFPRAKSIIVLANRSPCSVQRSSGGGQR